MNVYDETNQILKTYKIQANKSLGQNFLVRDEIAYKIIETAELDKNDLVIEIGPGLGVLTNRLLQKCSNVVCIELDKRMIEILQDRFKFNIDGTYSSKLELINEDVLNIDLENIIKKKKKECNINKVKVVANLPYYISTPIIIKLLEARFAINDIIVMVQKEVADRITAKTGTRLAGAITYVVEYYSKAEEVIDVPKESFIPSPKVESEVIKLEIRDNPSINVKDERFLFDLIQRSFTQRRKTLSNCLLNYGFAKKKQDVEQMWKTLGMNSNVRGESLNLEQFAQIADYLKNMQ